MSNLHKETCFAYVRPSLFWTLTISTARIAFVFLLGSPAELALAQNPGTDSQQTPSEIPEFQVDGDPTGKIATYQPSGPTDTANNAFFQNLGTNGRTCFTCHQPQTGWTVSAAAAQARFYGSAGMDPLFRPVDGATCPTADVSTLQARQQAYQLLTSKGLIRIAIQLPAKPNLQFEVSKVYDPYHCTTNPAFGLLSKTTGKLSMYRRPLPATNLGFLSTAAPTIMWDGREPNLAQQSIDATTGHAEANAAPSPAQQDQIVAFETGIFTAQISDNQAGNLNAAGASGGPVALSFEIANFFVGVNDPLGKNPKGTPFNPNIFNLYSSRRWLEDEDEEGEADVTPRRASIARGQVVFNTTPITIKGVAGLNDVLGMDSIPGFCGTCHDTPNVGNHSVKAPLNIGIANAGANAPPAIDISGLPVFTLKCKSGPLAGQAFVVTDPGRALITGNCADIGKVKGPILRGLAARAPYFHNGSATTLMDAVNFYDQRFNIGFTDQQKQDLVNFLNAL
jgi:cytochrome c peroxidase